MFHSVAARWIMISEQKYYRRLWWLFINATVTRHTTKIWIPSITRWQKNVRMFPQQSLKTAGGPKPTLSFKLAYITPLPLTREDKWKSSFRDVITAASLMLFVKRRGREREGENEGSVKDRTRTKAWCGSKPQNRMFTSVTGSRNTEIKDWYEPSFPHLNKKMIRDIPGGSFIDHLVWALVKCYTALKKILWQKEPTYILTHYSLYWAITCFLYFLIFLNVIYIKQLDFTKFSLNVCVIEIHKLF